MKIFAAIITATMLYAQTGYCADAAFKQSEPGGGAYENARGKGDNPFYIEGHSLWDDTSCAYDGNDFMIWYDGQGFKKPAEYSSRKAVCASGMEIAGLYDGRNIMVFAGRRRSFRLMSANYGYTNAAISAGNSLVALYDGREFIVYDQRSDGFNSFRGINASYRGAAVSAGNGAALAYDGNNVIAYCSATRSFVTASAEDGAAAKGMNKMEAELLVGDTLFTVNPETCEISSN